MSNKYEDDDVYMEDASTTYSNLCCPNSLKHFKIKKPAHSKMTYYQLLKSTDQLSINKRIDNIVLNNYFNNFKQNRNTKDESNENYINVKNEYNEQLEKQYVENYYRVRNKELFKTFYN